MAEREHRFAREQHVEVKSEEWPPVVEIVALLPGHCREHRAPMYGCVHGGAHFAFCEEIIQPLSPTNRSKLN